MVGVAALGSVVREQSLGIVAAHSHVFIDKMS
jgi:hypothetical protein